jgi:hypothetical protein
MIRRTPPPPDPWCVMGMIGFGYIVRAIKTHEANAAHYMKYGWIVIARDTDMPFTRELPPGQAWWPYIVAEAKPMPDDNGANEPDGD